ncbi:MAG: hypothetical protein GEV13_26660 [Rhodospirillales bacterium]|nr:hypothetical protein [Rhodospirillales bacterium]
MQNIAPISAPTGLNVAAPAPGVGLAPVQLNVPGLALTPAQVTTLASGNVTSINQLLGQLVGGNTTNQQLTTLMNAIITPTPTPTPPAFAPSLPPVSTPPTPPVVTGGPQPPLPPTPPPVVTNPVNYVSRS